MGKIAYVFPGQGAQEVGMGADAYEQHAEAAACFREADEVLGYKLSEIIFQGPEAELKLTYHTQPALLTTSCAYLKILAENGVQPDYVAGHSLGEYSALVCAGVMSFRDAVHTVRKRGEFMDQAVPAGLGSMAAVIGGERDALAELCAKVSREVGAVEMANVNCPGQIVVSGTVQGVKGIIERGKEIGAKRVIPLEVSGPFHSSLMKPAAERLQEVLAGIDMQDAKVPVIANVTAHPVTNGDEIRRLLVDQVVSPVLWEDSVRWLLAQGVDTFVEIGPGAVLSGLIRKIDRSATVLTVNSCESVQAAVEALQG
jgi:[acyl-carrier-protein] S-malonyltransferase